MEPRELGPGPGVNPTRKVAKGPETSNRVRGSRETRESAAIPG